MLVEALSGPKFPRSSSFRQVHVVLELLLDVVDEADVAPVVGRPEPVLLRLIGVGGILDMLQPGASLTTRSRL